MYNLGSGEGTSVWEIVDAVLRVTGVDVRPVIEPRRAGDSARIVADGGHAARDLGWEPRHPVEEMAGSAGAAWGGRPR